MPVDLKYLQRHYASLSDEALLEIKRADLVEGAQEIYDRELGGRQLTEPVGLTAPAEEEPKEDTEKPDWLKDAMEVYSTVVMPGGTGAYDAANAREALTAEGIPCYLELYEMPEEDTAVRERPQRMDRWRLMVPGNLNMHAASVLDREVFNADFENEWRGHLESFSDEELREMHPQSVFCGLFDRVERVMKAWNEELDRRGLVG